MRSRKQSDRRKVMRYALKTEVFVVFRPAFDRLGMLKDLSVAGAAFEYPVYDHYEKLDDGEVDIFTSHPEHFMLGRVQCRVVYDILLDRPSASGVETRRCGVLFECLSSPHRQLLEELLGKFGSPLPP